jgi:hypothetical protein
VFATELEDEVAGSIPDPGGLLFLLVLVVERELEDEMTGTD